MRNDVSEPDNCLGIQPRPARRGGEQAEASSAGEVGTYSRLENFTQLGNAKVNEGDGDYRHQGVDDPTVSPLLWGVFGIQQDQKGKA